MNVSILSIFLGEECSKYRLFSLSHWDIRMKISQAARGILVHGSCTYAGASCQYFHTFSLL